MLQFINQYVLVFITEKRNKIYELLTEALLILNLIVYNYSLTATVQLNNSNYRIGCYRAVWFAYKAD